MKLSHRWLARHLEAMPDPVRVQQGIEQLGIEVVGTSRFGHIFHTVELVEVISRVPHPDSDHLSLVDVRRGDGSVSRIVTGAANGFPGDRLWYGPPGTELPDGRVLERKSLRGVESPGMLLSAEELGFQATGGDLWVWSGPEPLGTRFLEVIGGEDLVYELEMTPSTASYLQSVRKIAEALAGLWGVSLKPLPSPFEFRQDPLARVEAEAACPRYGLVEMHVKPGQVSPLWMQVLLRSIGLRVIHPAVDATNFVLWDLGEPLHAFDASQVELPITVRLARPGETLTLLDGKTITLTPEDLVIADRVRALALAGVMGGQGSAVTENTRTIYLESAHFAAPGVFRSMRRHQLTTDAGLHFGKGTDPAMVDVAPTVVQVLLAEAGALAETGRSQVIGDLPAARRIVIEPDRIAALLGVDWSWEKMAAALEGFGYRVTGFTVTVPRERHDVETEYDVAEDIARFYGMDAVPSRLPVMPLTYAARDVSRTFLERLRDRCAESGMMEVVTRTLSSPEREAGLHIASWPPVMITNPLRDEERMLRRELLTSLLEVVRYNRARRDEPVNIFEVGAVFRRDGEEVVESYQLAMVLTLGSSPAYPSRSETTVHDLLARVIWITERLGWAVHAADATDAPDYLHPGRSVRLVDSDGVELGWLGELRPRIAELFQARRLAVLLMDIPAHVTLVTSTPRRISRFPSVVRDLSLVVPPTRRYAEVLQTIRDNGGQWLQDVGLIDRFVGDFGQSWTFRLVFQATDRTLTDEAIDGEIQSILRHLDPLGITLRQ
ncbi:MAG: phenylalanine--tRNA ligase subunit beta [Sulfobacillus sp.]|nr:phenylalanine--tRNA ligase subunit beta [Sulfobacillus sp.]